MFHLAGLSFRVQGISDAGLLGVRIAWMFGVLHNLRLLDLLMTWVLVEELMLKLA